MRNLSLKPQKNENLRFLEFCLNNLHLSKAQLFQDLFVLYELHDKKKGFFVEFGATNGIGWSNTYLLEKKYQWNGILAEPAKCWHDDLKKNRRCNIELRCVWKKTGEHLEFNEISDLSTINLFSRGDTHASTRENGKRYMVETISLNDLLSFHHAPRKIDYLSVDTEGSEYSILKSFNFEKHEISIITVEHAYISPDRENIHSLLKSKGYVRKFENYSDWNDWYIKEKL